VSSTGFRTVFEILLNKCLINANVLLYVTEFSNNIVQDVPRTLHNYLDKTFLGFTEQEVSLPWSQKLAYVDLFNPVILEHNSYFTLKYGYIYCLRNLAVTDLCLVITKTGRRATSTYTKKVIIMLCPLSEHAEHPTTNSYIM
jgi:hypothetical protein